MMLFLLFFGPLTLLFLLRFYNLTTNYFVARRFRLPIIIIPVSFEEPLWILLQPLFWWVEYLPFGLGRWYIHTSIGGPMEDGIKTISRLGETFVLVSPTRNQICTADPDAVDAIYRDNKNFIIPDPFSQVFTHYGQNVSSLNGPDWQRHRKVTGAAFSDKMMHYVWDESIERANKDLHFLEAERCNLAEMRSNFNVLAMNVLATVGFGQETALTTIPPGHRQSLMDSLEFVLKNVFVMIIFAGLKAPDFILPPMLRKLKTSVAEFRLFMEEAVVRQLKTEKSSEPSLLQAMVTANEAEKAQHQISAGKASYLTDSELFGNLFVFNLAGFETTAGTFSFTLPYLALYPEMQVWVVEEIDRHRPPFSKGGYQELYPKLVRCMAVMYETLRLAGPVSEMLRTPLVPTVLSFSSTRAKSNESAPTSITIQPDTLITAHFYGMHLSPRWGGDAQSFNPIRFVNIDPATGVETLATPVDKGLSASFLPWVMGPRICPGKKFSQVEFVAVIAQILSRYRVEVDVNEAGGESLYEAKQRLKEILDEKYFNVSAHIRRPKMGGLRFVRR